MSIRPKQNPTLCRHKGTGHAYAKFDGRQLWFGPHDEPETQERFTRTLAEWRANGCHVPSGGVEEGLLVEDVVARYLEFAEVFYSGPDGTPTREIENLRNAVRPLLELYGTLPVADFHIRQLKTLREQWIDRGLARKTINDRVNRILRIMGWAAEEELCKPEVLSGLKALRPLRRGRSGAKEGKRVLPVSWEHVEAVLSLVSHPVAGVTGRADRGRSGRAIPGFPPSLPGDA